MEKYKIIKQPDPAFRKSNAWFLECERNIKPFVVIRQKTKFCDVHWDFISVCRFGGRFSPVGALNSRIKVIMDKYWNMRKRYWIYGPVGTIPKLPLKQAESAAVEIYDLLASVPVMPYQHQRKV